MVRIVVGLFLGGIAALVLAICWPDRQMRSRDIGCAKFGQPRQQEICRAISQSMEWTWLGHAIISPGWRPTASSIASVYCREHIIASDLPVLESLAQGLPDWRLESAAGDLMLLLKNQKGCR